MKRWQVWYLDRVVSGQWKPIWPICNRRQARYRQRKMGAGWGPTEIREAP